MQALRSPIIIRCISLAGFIFSAFNLYCQSNTNLKLWYNKPAGNTWTDAMPLGNGFLGAMVYGNPDHEIISLNEGTVWSGGPNRNDNPDALKSLPEVRKLLFEGKYAEAQALAGRTMISKESQGMKFQPVGNLKGTNIPTGITGNLILRMPLPGQVMRPAVSGSAGRSLLLLQIRHW